MKSLVLGILSGNYIYQYMQDIPDYLVSTERSFFQLFAITAVIIYLKINGKLKQ